jgi:hypothetical protein
MNSFGTAIAIANTTMAVIIDAPMVFIISGLALLFFLSDEP